MNITGTTRVFLILGDPVAQVRAPEVFNHLFRKHGADAVLVPAQVPPARFADFARTRGVALATHDDTTLEHVDEAVALGAAMSEFPTTMAAARHARARGLATIAGAPTSCAAARTRATSRPWTWPTSW